MMDSNTFDLLYVLVQAIVPVSVCVFLPIVICFIISRVRRNYDNNNARIVLKAIEANPTIDAEKFIASLSKPRKTPDQILHGHLLRGCIFSFLGVAAIILIIVATRFLGFSSDAFFIMVIAGVCLAVGAAYLILYFVSRPSGNSDKE